MSLDKTRRSRLFGGTLFAAFGLFQLYVARHAEITHPVIPSKGSWYTPDVGYLVAVCFFAMVAYLLVSVFRASDDQKH